MPKAQVTDPPPETPLCIRFKKGTLDGSESSHGVRERSEWIRSLALGRAKQIVAGEKSRPSALTYETAQGTGQQICVRFKPADYALVRSAAEKEGAKSPSAWIRAVIVLSLRRKATKKAG